MEFDFESDGQESLPGFGLETEKEEEQISDNPLFRHQSLEDSLASLYKPPYSKPREAEPALPPLEEKSPVFPEEKSSLLSSYVADETPRAAPAVEEEESKKGGLWPLLFLAIGSQLLTLGILLFFFSDSGTLTLQWNASRWFVYCLFSLPLIYIGYRQVVQSTDTGSRK